VVDGLKPFERSPAAPCTWVPAYCHVVTSYSSFSASQPEKRPSLSSVSEKSSLTITEAFVYRLTYSSNQRSCSRM
jgi:hypothetical protein